MNQALDWTVSHGRVVALSYALFDAPKKLFEASDEEGIIEAAIKFSTNDRVSGNYHYFSLYLYFDVISEVTHTESLNNPLPSVLTL